MIAGKRKNSDGQSVSSSRCLQSGVDSCKIREIGTSAVQELRGTFAGRTL